jgi:hypothetical protein
MAAAPAFFIDFEAFQHGDEEPQMKELCVIDADRPMEPLYFVFTPHMDWYCLSEEHRKTYNYQTRRVHRLHWLDGITRYCRECVLFHIAMKFPRWKHGMFYVLDKPVGPKVEFLNQEFPQLRVVNYNGLTFNTLPEPCIILSCPYKAHGKHCAFRKCLQLYTHFHSLNSDACVDTLYMF